MLNLFSESPFIYLFIYLFIYFIITSFRTTTSQVAILKPRLVFTLFYDIIYTPTFELYTPTLL